MWEEFHQGYEEYDFYKGHEEAVRDAIERTHDIAWQKCEDTWIDTSVKLPKFGTPEKPAFKMLSDLVKEAMIREGLASNPEYVERVKEEMSDIKYLGYEAYFLAMYKIFHLAEKRYQLVTQLDSLSVHLSSLSLEQFYHQSLQVLLNLEDFLLREHELQL